MTLIFNKVVIVVSERLLVKLKKLLIQLLTGTVKIKDLKIYSIVLCSKSQVHVSTYDSEQATSAQQCK